MLSIKRMINLSNTYFILYDMNEEINSRTILSVNNVKLG